MARKFINPSDEVESALNETLKKLYPDDTETHRSIDYNKGKGNCLFTAYVTFYWTNSKSDSALFEYKRPSPYEKYYWYCVRDWKD
jgi:hypothetical protein